MKRTHAGGLRADHAGERVKLQGWVHRRRDLGGLTFLQLRDGSGVVQAVVRPEDHPESAAVLEPVRLEWVVEIEGLVALRDPEAVNPDMETGEVEVIADRALVLSRAEPLPFLPDTPVEEVAEETRLRYRYLDLRRRDLQRNLILRDRITLEILNYFNENGFVHLETPILTRSTPEGARDYLVPSRVRQGTFYALPQSPQIFKQILMISGFERYVQIARCFRDEDLRADRQPEFTQVDVEMSFITEEDIYSTIEGLFARIFPIVGIEAEPPFPRLTYREAMLRYGTDRPDLRLDLEIGDVSAVVAESEFRAFKRTVADGGVVRGFAVPSGAAASRKQIDGWVETARARGAMGVLTLRHRNGGLEFQLKNVLSDGELEAIAGALGLEDGGIAILVAAQSEIAAAALGDLRVQLGAEFELVPTDENRFLWVTEFPLVERDSKEDRWTGVHHPFTSPMPEDVALLDTDPGAVRARAYDVVLNGVELGGGSIRIHDSTLQQRIFGLLGMSDEEARRRFGFLLEALSYGAPPHGGIALGLDRIVMLMTGARSLRDVITFPKTTSATSLMTSAPAPVDTEQLEELGIALRAPSAEAKEPGQE
ncbi:MAG: aspartate--tRNA ligase [Thermoanaerobaculia bacterium]